MIIDCHVHLGKQPPYPESSTEEVLRVMNEAEVDMSVIFPVWNPLAYTQSNEKIADAVEKQPSRLIGFARVKFRVSKGFPMNLFTKNRFPDPITELKHAFHNLKLRGIKNHPIMDGTPHEDFLNEVAKMEIPIIFHSGKSFPPHKLLDIFERYSDIRMILAHMGSFGANGFRLCDEAIRFAKKCDNVFLDTSGFQFQFKIKEAIKELGSEKILFGSDFPLLHPLAEIIKINTLKITESEKRMVLGENTARILRLQ